MHGRLESFNVPNKVPLSKLTSACSLAILYPRDVNDIIGFLGVWMWESEDDMVLLESNRMPQFNYVIHRSYLILA